MLKIKKVLNWINFMRQPVQIDTCAASPSYLHSDSHFECLSGGRIGGRMYKNNFEVWLNKNLPRHDDLFMRTAITILIPLWAVQFGLDALAWVLSLFRGA
jgi:hypothetical protein